MLKLPDAFLHRDSIRCRARNAGFAEPRFINGLNQTYSLPLLATTSP